MTIVAYAPLRGPSITILAETPDIGLWLERLAIAHDRRRIRLWLRGTRLNGRRRASKKARR